MSAFTGRLEVAEIITDTVWEILLPFRYDSDVAKRGWDIPHGFLTDFASVKRAPIAYWLAGGVGDKAAVVHDYCYQTHDVESKDMADRVFYEVLGVLGIAIWRRWPMYQAVKYGGQKSWDSGPSRYTVLTAMVADARRSGEALA